MIVIPISPVGKGRPRFRRIRNFVQTYTDKKTQEYEKTIAKEYIRLGGKHHRELPIALTVCAWFEIPKSWSKTKRDSALRGELNHTIRVDCDNIVKAVQDALNGVAYVDDKQIVRVYCSKQYGGSSELHIDISPMTA